MKKRYKIIFLVFLAFLLFLITFILLYSYTPIVDRAVLTLMNLAVSQGVEIRYDRLEGDFIGNIRILNPQITFGNDTLKAREIHLKYTSKDLLSGFVNIQYLAVDSAEFIVHVEQESEDKKQIKTEDILSDSTLSGLDLSGLPKLNITDLHIKDGIIRLIRDSEEEHFNNIQFSSNVVINSEKVEVRVKYLKGYWEKKDIPLNQLSFILKGSQKRVTLNQFRVDLPGAEVYAHGEIELVPEVRLLVFADTSKLDFSLIHKLTDSFPYKNGYLRFYGDYIGHPLDFTGNIYLQGQMDSISFNNVSAQFDYHKQTFSLNRMLLSTNFGYMSGKIQVVPEGENRISLKYQHVDLKKAGLAQKNTNINGKLNLNFNTWNIKKISGKGVAQFYDLKYGLSKIDTLLLTLKVQDGNWDLQKGSRLVVEKSSQFFLEGKMNRNRIVDFHLYTDENLIDTLATRLSLGPIGGIGSLEIDISGNLEDPDINGYVLLDSLIYQRNTAYGVEGKFEIKGIFSERLGFFKLELSSGVVQNIPLTDGVMDMKISKNTILLDSISFYNENNYITMKGAIEKKLNEVDVKLSKFEFRYRDYFITSVDTLISNFSGDSLIVEEFVLNATGDGEIEVRGMLDFSGESGMAVYFKNIQLFPFNQFLNWEYPLEGLLEISVELSGDIKNPIVETYLELQNFVMENDTIGHIDAEFSYDNNIVEIDRFELNKFPSTFVNMKGQVVLPKKRDGKISEESAENERIDFLADFGNIDIQNYPFFKKFNFPVNGIFGGHLELSGTVVQPQGKFSLIGENIQYRDYEFPFFRVDGQLSPNAITLDAGKLNFMNTDINFRGEKIISWDINNISNIFSDKRFSLFIKIQDDSISFLNVLTPEVDLLLGNVDADLKLGGSIEKPELLGGNLSITNGTLYLSKLENPISDLQFSSIIEGHILKIQKGNALLLGEVKQKNFFQKYTSLLFAPFKKLLFPSKKDGKVKISGNIDFADMRRPKLDLKAGASQVLVNYYLENARLLVSAENLKITGKDTLLIQGDITVHNGEVDLDLKESEKNLLLSTTVREIPPYIKYMLDVSIPGNLYVRSGATFNSFDMMLRGDLQISQEPKGVLEMYGNLEVPKGKYFQFEEFNIRDGRVEFINPKELPELNIYAEKKKYGYLFQLQVSGNINNPIKEIRIFDLQSREDITHLYPETKDQISLLLFGLTFNELGSSAGNVVLEKGQEVINQALVSRIEREARHFIGLDEIRVESQESTTDYNTQRLNQPSEKNVLSLGKYLTPSIYLEYKTQLGASGLPGIGDIPTPRLGWEAGNQIFLEYKINRNWSVSTYYEKQLYDKFKIDISWRLSF